LTGSAAETGGMFRLGTVRETKAGAGETIFTNVRNRTEKDRPYGDA
jgi:hypothetical protein